MCIFKPQKVLHLKDELKKKNPKLHGTYAITEKYNGWFVYFYYNSATQQWSTPYSSAGRSIPSLAWTTTLTQKFPKPYADSLLIAEAYAPNMHFSELNGLLNRSVGDCAFYECIFKCHDLISLPTAVVETANSRHVRLQEFLKYTANYNLWQMQSAEIILITGYDKKLWEYKFNEIVDKGGEGIVAKRLNDAYAFGKRTSSLIKLKMECTIDALAVRLEERIGEKGNDSLVLISKRKNGTEISTVISRHAEKALFRLTPNSIVGKVVEIKAMEELPNGQLIQPVFIRVRNDKDNVNYD